MKYQREAMRSILDYAGLLPLGVILLLGLLAWLLGLK